LSRSIPLLVEGELWRPIFEARAWHPALPASRMLMPETSMNENRFQARRKDKIWFSGKVFAVKPESIAQAMQYPAQQKFRSCVL
jgi:hypothetical protein